MTTSEHAVVLQRVVPRDVSSRRGCAVSGEALREVEPIVERVRREGVDAVRAFAHRFGEIEDDAELFYDSEALDVARHRVPDADLALLERVCERVVEFARAQREALGAVDVRVPGGRAGHTVVPVDRAGCYAPGGRYPLPSSVLMTAAVARTAGVEEVWVASPRPSPLVLAAAAVAGADGLLAAGGAHAIAALAYGAGPVPPCDVVVGPGNRWVTAAKLLVSADVGIDMLAGPSELVVVADDSADASWVAADLLAQAEHDPDAFVGLVTTRADVVEAVEEQLATRLADLSVGCREVARQSLRRGVAVQCDDWVEAASVVNRLAPEHLALHLQDPGVILPWVRHYGTLFVGHWAAEVLGDYGAGPNHVLPTGAGARHRGGLSVLSFVRVRTWLRIDDGAQAASLLADAERLARLEGLEAHAASAAIRRRGATHQGGAGGVR